MLTEAGEIEVFLVEDSVEDQMFAHMAMEAIEAPCRLSVVAGALDGYHLLHGRLAQGLPLPDVIVTDLRMPEIDGHQLLERLVAETEINHLPFVVLSSSASSKDVALAAGNGAVHYAVKPSDFDDLCDTFRRVIDIARGCDRGEEST